MSKINWRNGFASGLIVGSVLVVLLCVVVGLATATIDPTPSGNACGGASSYDCADNSEQVPYGWYWLRRAFAVEDTIAQWIMMAFTIAAAGLLLGTLKATQQMAFDTKRIGVAQTRAFIVVTPNFARQYYDDFQVSFGVSNGGMTGAFNARLRCTIAIYFDGREVTSSSGWKNLGMLEGGRRMEKIEILFPFEAMSIPATLTDDKRYHAIIDAFVVYSDVFKIKHTNHLKVGLFPKIGSGEGKIILKNEEQSEPRDDWLG